MIELQRLAQAGNADIAELVRRALTIATKLRLQDARSWIEHELKGYPPKVELPSYRIVPSELRVKNPFHGWNPVAWGGGGNLQEHFASSEIRSPLAEIIEIASGTGQPHASLAQAEMDVNSRCGTNEDPRLVSGPRTEDGPKDIQGASAEGNGNDTCTPHHVHWFHN